MIKFDFKRNFINAFLRGLTLGTKFILLFSLAKLYGAKVIGVYGLIFSLVSLFTYVLGFEYYNVSGREFILNKKNKDRINVLINHFSVILTGSILIPLIGFVPYFYSPLNGFEFLVVGLLFFELLSNEIYRMLIFMEKQIQASVLMFVRSAIWVYIFLFVYFIFSKNGYVLPSNYLYSFWLGSSALSIVLGLVLMGEYKSVFFKIRLLVFSKFYDKIKLAKDFFFNAIFQRLIFTIDKYVLSFFSGVDITGIYTFFVGIALSMNSFMDAGVYSIYYPKLIKERHSYAEFENQYKRFSKVVMIVAILLFAFYLIVFYPMIYVLNKVDFKGYIIVYIIVVSSITIMNYSGVYHYLLYVYGKERYIFISMLYSFVFFVVLIIPVIYLFGIYGLSALLLLTFFIMLYLKRRFCNILSNGKVYFFGSKD